MPGVYRIEASPNKRAGCQATECKKAGVKIQAGELRFGTFVTIQEHQSWRWKHWGCVTPQQISNVQESVEGNLEAYLDGYEDLDEHDKARVAKAVEEGHVADEDWKGDVEVNRPGQKGFRTPASKRAAREEAKAKKEAVEDEDDSPSAPAEKKRRKRTKKEVDVEDDEEPAPKKVKTAAKRGDDIRAEDKSDGKSKSKEIPPKTAKPKIERKSRRMIKAEEEDENDIAKIPTKKPRASRKAARKTVKSEDVDTDDENDIAKIPTKKPRASRKAAPKTVKSEDVDADDDEPDLKAGVSDEAEEAEDDDLDYDVDSTKGSKAKKARKPTVKRETRGTAAKSRLPANPKEKTDVTPRATEKAKRTNGRARRS